MTKLTHIIFMVLLTVIALALLVIADAQHTIAQPIKNDTHITLKPYEYSLMIEDDQTIIHDSQGRLIGIIPFDEHSKLDSLILKDNE